MSTTPPPAPGYSSLKRSASVSSVASDDDRYDLSFKYVTDADGNVVRVSLGRSNTPLTPPEVPRAATPEDSPSPSPPFQPRRQSLGRSESLPGPDLKPSTSTTPANPARSFARTTSGPIPTVTPGARLVSSLATGLPRRPSASEDYRRHELERLQTHVPADPIHEEKENMDDNNEHQGTTGVGSLKRRTLPPRSAPPMSSESHLYSRSLGGGAKPANALVAQQQRERERASRQTNPMPVRVARRVAPVVRDQAAIEARERERERAAERERERERTSNEYPENDVPDIGALSLAERPQAGTRYRRSASVSEGPSPEPPRYRSNEPIRPGSSASNRVARAALESRYRRELAAAEDTASESERERERERYQEREPSPSLRDRRSGSDEFRPSHARRGSDTVRHLNGSVVGSAPAIRVSASSSSSLRTHIPSPPPPSPPPRFPSPPPLDSPTAGVALPPRLSPGASSLANGRHRRSPTAPEPSTGSTTLAPSESGPPPAQTWAGNEKVEWPSAPVPVQPAPVSAPMPAAAPPPRPATAVPAAARPAPLAPQMMHQSQRNANIIVNNKAYARLNLLGKGGSSRVFRALTANNEILAIKRVALDQADPETIAGYMNEIRLLQRLEGHKRIIRLYDSEVVQGPKSYLNMVLECGEVDLAKLLTEAAGKPLNMIKVADYWQQMLEAVHVVHEQKIVHSDLKPANFVLVRGQLKLIDFGIANAIAADTTNIQRDHQIGTVNYMSPEAIEVPDGMRRLKVGRPSDIWSLGCILYQMIYGLPPFHRFAKPLVKMKAIPDPKIEIDFATHSVPIERRQDGSVVRLEHLARKVRSDVIVCMQSCLNRTPKERATIPELLEQGWLTFAEPEARVIEIEKPAPRLRDMLAEDETVINPYYMEQLMDYVLKLGSRYGPDMDRAQMQREGLRLIQELKDVHAQEEERRIELAQQAAAQAAEEQQQ
ncbi:unnamed protein product [Peniophora sp. CBMAI 1063]|nr:unnamed protein product [Peniophora sp. CBMAI 1063]